MYGDGPGNCFEGMTTLAALASATTRIRLGLLVTGVTYRHPSVLAAQAVTVDHASGGRLELAVGAAWYEPEHRQLGIDFPPVGERFDRLQDTLEILTRLFTGDVVDYTGRTVSLDQAQLRPRPVQQPGPPLWIGGSGPRRTLPLVARYADMWHCYEPAVRRRELSEQVDAMAAEAGRDPSSIGRAGSLSLSEPWPQVRRSALDQAGSGVSYLVCGWPEEGAGRVQEFAREVMPALA
jgi:alkanesulfonate monooxygenase SsuD/methylene tetrahydromethanopterin reductase-like flavin-dependent oxidoreductase (luciferase family)